jgi:hypothetical protein
MGRFCPASRARRVSPSSRTLRFARPSPPPRPPPGPPRQGRRSTLLNAPFPSPTSNGGLPPGRSSKSSASAPPRSSLPHTRSGSTGALWFGYRRTRPTPMGWVPSGGHFERKFWRCRRGGRSMRGGGSCVSRRICIVLGFDSGCSMNDCCKSRVHYPIEFGWISISVHMVRAHPRDRISHPSQTSFFSHLLCSGMYCRQ